MLSRRHILLGGAGLITGTLFSSSAFAHRERFTLTQIIWSPDSASLDITHSYHLHDAETALAEIGVLAKPDLLSLKAKARLALYTAENFSLRNAMDDSPIPLELIGAENEGRTSYVYQQAFLAAPPDKLWVDCRMFRGVVAEQINNVDVNYGNGVNSLLFRGDDPAKIVNMTDIENDKADTHDHPSSSQ